MNDSLTVASHSALQKLKHNAFHFQRGKVLVSFQHLQIVSDIVIHMFQNEVQFPVFYDNVDKFDDIRVVELGQKGNFPYDSGGHPFVFYLKFHAFLGYNLSSFGVDGFEDVPVGAVTDHFLSDVPGGRTFAEVFTMHSKFLKL